MQLSDHFSLSELTKSMTASRLDIDNSLDPDNNSHADQICRLAALSKKVLEPIRAHFDTPFSPQSGFRSFALERVLCAASIKRFIKKGRGTEQDYLERKQHPKGEAADIEVPGVANLDLARWIEDNLDSDQLILEFYDFSDPRAGWVHVSYHHENANRHEVLTIGKHFSSKGLPAQGD